jgi:hypothetical protein
MVHLFGKFIDLHYKTSRTAVDIDLTPHCNLKCLNCCKLCKQAPSSDYIDVCQIEKFVNESISRNVRWEIIRIIGGEPTLHPEIFKIIDVLRDYKLGYNPSCKIDLFTNGIGKTARHILLHPPADIDITNSNKTSIYQLGHCPVTVAPRDFIWYKFADFSTKCQAASACGLSFTPYGYYQCAVAGSIDRVLGLNIGRMTLPSESDSMTDQADSLCTYCGCFIFPIRRTLNPREELTSSSWIKALQEYNTCAPILSKY